MKMIHELSTDWLRVIWSFISGFAMAVYGHLLPIQDIMLLLICLFIADMFFGYWAANKLRGEKFSAKIIWKTTMPRFVISLVLIIGTFYWDKVFDQTVVSTYKVCGWFISGVLLANIVQNGYRITKWDVLLGLGDWIKSRAKRETGIDYREEAQNEIH